MSNKISVEKTQIMEYYIITRFCYDNSNNKHSQEGRNLYTDVLTNTKSQM